MASTLSQPLARQPSESEMDSWKHIASASGNNCFFNRTMRLSALAWVETTIVGLTLFPIRLVFTILNVIAMVLVANLGTCCLRREDLKEPLPLWRRVILWPLRPLLRVQLFLFSFHWISVRGRLAPKAAAPIITPNHITFVDPIALISIAGGTPVAAIENSRLPVIGPIFIALQTMFVERAGAKTKAARKLSTTSAMASAVAPEPATAATPQTGGGAAAMPKEPTPAASGDAKPKATAPNAVKEEIQRRASDPAFTSRVLLFPEGTCANGTTIISFKLGAFIPGLPVQPVTVRYPWASHFDPSWPAASPPVGALILRAMTRLHTPMNIHFLNPYVPNEAEKADPKLFATNVQQVMAADLGVRTTQHSFEDVMLASVASKAHYPVDKAVVEFEALRSVLDIDAKAAQGYLQRFMSADAEQSGRLTYEQFKQLLLESPRPTDAADSAQQAPQGGQTNTTAPASARGAVVSARGESIGREEELRRLFQLLDADESGSIEFRELLVGLAILNEQGQRKGDDSMALVFRLLDTSGHGRLTKPQLEGALRSVWPTMAQDALDAAFSEADANGDGLISISEFVNWTRTHESFMSGFRNHLLGSDNNSILRRTFSTRVKPAVSSS